MAAVRRVERGLALEVEKGWLWGWFGGEEWKAGAKKIFKFTLDTPLRGGHEIVYNCVVFGRIVDSQVRVGFPRPRENERRNESVWELNVEARRSSGKTN